MADRDESSTLEIIDAVEQIKEQAKEEGEEEEREHQEEQRSIDFVHERINRQDERLANLEIGIANIQETLNEWRNEQREQQEEEPESSTETTNEQQEEETQVLTVETTEAPKIKGRRRKLRIW